MPVALQHGPTEFSSETGWREENASNETSEAAQVLTSPFAVR
jgi:hypothetical protein